jgi:hypothetical protein
VQRGSLGLRRLPVEVRKIDQGFSAFLLTKNFIYREQQLDIKKWQVKQAERQRQVKLSASDWVDHPDRYLLELGGRPTYAEQGT